MGEPSPAFGTLLRQWRVRRRLSQLDLGLEAGVSARHVSFLETGRAQPSREMVHRLAAHLDVPLRERNPMLLAADFAPAYSAHALDDAPMKPVRDALDLILRGYSPYPALAVDRGWTLVAANDGLAAFTSGVAPELLRPPVNVLRLALHPDGLAPRIANLPEWRGHLLDRLDREAAATTDPALATLHAELTGYPGGEQQVTGPELAVPLRIRVDGRELSFLSTITTFGTARDLTLAELSVEAFLPADAETSEALHRASDPVRPRPPTPAPVAAT